MGNITNIRDINPLEHLTSDVAKSRYNYESILNGIVEWSNSKLENVTVRLATDHAPYFVDYTFPTKYAHSGTAKGVVDVDSTPGAFSYSLAYDLPALYHPDNTLCDTVKFRVTVGNSAGAKWAMYAMAVIYDEPGNTVSREYCKNLYVRRLVNGSPVICKTVADVHVGDAWSEQPLSVDPSSNWMHAVEPYDPKKLRYYTEADGVMVSYSGRVYRITGSVESRIYPDNPNSGWSMVCEMLSNVDKVVHNQMYYHNGEFYLYKADDANRRDILWPEEDGDSVYWASPSVMYLNMFDVSRSSTFRWKATTDVSGFVMRQELASPAMDSTIPDIGMIATLEMNSGTETDNTHKGVAIFDSCNYSMWPSSENAIWTMTGTYSTDISIPTSRTQDYTAKMVFHHADKDTKCTNIINYDGPDLDQGLAIYLPIRDKVVIDGNNTFKEPCDGYTFEFLFRIWPNPAYNGQSTADLIINKAHIYVYSVESSDALDGTAPIAKFSMARLTNFYVFAENIGVPNRPVLYKAKFVYSEKKHAWETYDYYQMPDHIFLSPKGFVDPSVRSDDTYGVETAGFPLYQDPFSGLDLSRIMVDKEYPNRMQ